MVSGPLRPFVFKVATGRVTGVDPLALVSLVPVGFDSIGNILGNLGDLISRDVIEKELKSLGRDLVIALRRNTPIGASRRLIDSTGFSVFEGISSDGKPNLTLELRQGATNRFTGFKYQIAVRKGRKAGKPPPSTALEDWVVKKLGVTVELSPEVAFRIARSIGFKGTKGNEYYFRTLQENVSRIQRAADNMSKAIVVDVMGRIRVETEKQSGLLGF